jgi:periplasmic protein TonB
VTDSASTSGFYEKIAVCIAVSLAVHAVIRYGVAQLPMAEPPPKPKKIEVHVVSKPRDPDPEPPKQPEPEPKPPEPKPVVHDKPRAPAQKITVQSVAPKDAPPTEHAVVAETTTTTPVFGVTMESTSQGGGPAVPVGNTTQPTPNAGSATVKPLAEPVAAYEVTKMPLPQGRCAGKYTDEAKQAGIEGVVVLDVIVGEDGRTRDVTVVSGLTHGLTEAAIAALRACHFDPGERNGTKVPVRIRGFKIRFVLAEGDQP